MDTGFVRGGGEGETGIARGCLESACMCVETSKGILAS